MNTITENLSESIGESLIAAHAAHCAVGQARKAAQCTDRCADMLISSAVNNPRIMLPEALTIAGLCAGMEQREQWAGQIVANAAKRTYPMVTSITHCSGGGATVTIDNYVNDYATQGLLDQLITDVLTSGPSSIANRDIALHLHHAAVDGILVMGITRDGRYHMVNATRTLGQIVDMLTGTRAGANLLAQVENTRV